MIPNTNTISSDFQKQVAALTAFDVASLTSTDVYGEAGHAVPTCVGVELDAAGTLVYTNRFGVDVTLALQAGFKPIRAQAIKASTTVLVTLYF